ncbi:YihY/virulence factor BrkB family protein [Rhodocytophaga rosea]|uniref:YihY/virulence factor BrkB family protein n=1 Tax=Rhodocytophaga rosea TaxID=2704465 RepID=A0A6C0GPX5_9BACT|nr:YihY/virulence factor BrkB family protein [Rhodocytophaga rosea]QHT70118.1 YihY/virulence factor BrkB family protein [Rhodocytophaga rosea]
MEKILVSVRKIIPVFIDAFARFKRNDPLRLSSSVAFFTIFALPPILILLIHLLGFVFSEEIVSGEFFEELSEAFGKATARQLQVIFHNIEVKSGSYLFTAMGVLFLCFVSTTLFMIVQQSINELWDIQLKHTSRRSRLSRMIKNRLMALLIIICTGLLVLSSLIWDTSLVLMGKYLVKLIPEYYVSLVHGGNHLITALIAMIWFAIIFKYLPDADTPWRVIWLSAGLTALLFEIGKMILGKLLVNSGVTSVYGAAGSIVIMLLFIFYSSMILFYGASFAKSYSIFSGKPIIPKEYATEYEINEVSREDIR